MIKKYTYAEPYFFKDNGFKFFIGASIVKQPVFAQHQFAELAIILDGTALHRVNSEAYPIGRGDVFVINNRTSHGFADVKNMRICNIMYDPDEFLKPFMDLSQLPGYHALFMLEPLYRARDCFRSRLRLAPAAISEIEALITVLTAEQQARGAGFRTAIRARFIELVLLLSRHYSQNTTSASQRLLRLGAVMAHLETHYAQPLRLPELAAMANLSINQFLRVFRSIYQTTPIEYVLKQRIMQARELLLSSDLNITDVAYETGFSDSNYFARAFRRVVKKSPREFRKTSA
jgi:AraC-like DNA-binding protein